VLSSINLTVLFHWLTEATFINKKSSQKCFLRKFLLHNILIFVKPKFSSSELKQCRLQFHFQERRHVFWIGAAVVQFLFHLLLLNQYPWTFNLKYIMWWQKWHIFWTRTAAEMHFFLHLVSVTGQLVFIKSVFQIDWSSILYIEVYLVVKLMFINSSF